MKSIAPEDSQKFPLPEHAVTDDLRDDFDVFFIQVGKRNYEELMEGSNTSRDFQKIPNLPAFKLETIGIQDLLKAASSLSNSKSRGMDGMTSRFLKDSLPITALPITQLINLSITTQNIPPI